MTKTELIEALAEYFGLEIPEKPNDIHDNYDWICGCSMGNDGPWLTLENVIDAISSAGLISDDDDDDDWDD